MPITASVARAEMKIRSIVASEGTHPFSTTPLPVLARRFAEGVRPLRSGRPQLIEWPARPCAYREVLALAGSQAVVARERDHRSIVRAELGAREERAGAGGGQPGRERLAQPPVGADSAGDDQRVEAGGLECAQRLRHQRVDDRVLEPACDVGTRQVVELAAAHGDDDGRFQAAEAEVEARTVEHGSRELEHARAAMFSQGRQRRPARVAEAEQLRRLVEGLTGGVVPGLPQDPVAANPLHLDQEGVATRDLQGHEREAGGARLEGGRQQMALQVMDADDGYAPGVAERARYRGADQKRADETGPRGIRNAVNGLRFGAGLRQDRFDHRQEALNVLARGELRHDPAVAAVQLDLAEDAVRHEALFAVVERNRRLVTGGFDA